MQYPITDHAAIECTRTFYNVLADGLPVDAAVAEVRTAINVGIKNSLEWGTPVLYMCSPDGVLFNLTDQPPAQPEALAAPQAASPQIALAASAAQETAGVPGVTRSIAAPEIRPRRTTHYTYREHDDGSVRWRGRRMAS